MGGNKSKASDKSMQLEAQIAKGKEKSKLEIQDQQNRSKSQARLRDSHLEQERQEFDRANNPYPPLHAPDQQ